MHTWQVGKFKVSKVFELDISTYIIDGLIPQADEKSLGDLDWLHPEYVNDQNKLLADVHSFIVDTGNEVILVDPGMGNGKSCLVIPEWDGLDTNFLAELASAGYQPEDIDIILCTHVHLDHVGWMTMQDEGGNWVPTFPRAKLVVVREEYDHYLSTILSEDLFEIKSDEDEENVDHVARAFLADDQTQSNQNLLMKRETLQPVIDTGRFEFVPPSGEVVPGIRYELLPGHTPSHHGIRLESEGESAFITGDSIHHPLQIARPEWSSYGDWDGDESARSRRTFLESCAGTDLLVLGTHFAGIGAGYIVTDGDGYAFTDVRPAAIV